jgi:hypothetical protein
MKSKKSVRVLIASVVKQRPATLSAFLRTLRWQRLAPHIDTRFLFIDDCDNAESSQMLREAGKVWDATPKPEGAEYSNAGSITHRWTVPTFNWLGAEKDRILRYAEEERFDAVLLADSDLLLAPDTLNSLLSSERDLVSAVFYTSWAPAALPLPQVWVKHPYEFSGGLVGQRYEADEFLKLLSERQLMRVGGLGACTLIRSAILPRISFLPVEGLPTHGMWQGEDRHFCVRATQQQVELWADAWPDVFHVYREADEEHIDGMLSLLEREHAPAHDDLVSFTISSLEPPHPSLVALKSHVRGRLGSLPTLPEIAETIAEMRPGEERILKTSFPNWYKVKEYQGREIAMHIKLLSRRPYGLHPTEADVRSTIEAFLA